MANEETYSDPKSVMLSGTFKFSELPKTVQLKILSFMTTKELIVLRVISCTWKKMSEEALAEIKNLSLKRLAAEFNVELRTNSGSTCPMNVYAEMIKNIFKYCHGLECFNGDRYAFIFEWFCQMDSSGISNDSVAGSLKKLIDVELIWHNPRTSRESKDRVLSNFTKLVELMIRDRQGVDPQDLEIIFRTSSQSLKTFSLFIERSPQALTGKTCWNEESVTQLVSKLPTALDRLEIIFQNRRGRTGDPNSPEIDLQATEDLRGLSLRNVRLAMPFNLPLLRVLKCSISDLNASEQKEFWSSLSKSTLLNYLSIYIRYVPSQVIEDLDEPEESGKQDSLDEYLVDFAERVNTLWKELEYLDLRIQNIVMSYQVNEFLRVILPRSLFLCISFSTLASIKLKQSDLSAINNRPTIKVDLRSTRGQNKMSYELKITPTTHIKQPRRCQNWPESYDFRLKGEFDHLFALPSSEPLLSSAPNTVEVASSLNEQNQVKQGTTEILNPS